MATIAYQTYQTYQTDLASRRIYSSLNNHHINRLHTRLHQHRCTMCPVHQYVLRTLTTTTTTTIITTTAVTSSRPLLSFLIHQ